MYALIKTGGQQHRAELGRYITVGRLPVDEGGQVTFEEVLLVQSDSDLTIGTPVVVGAQVTGTVRRHLRGPKVKGLKYKPKKGYMRRWGAREDLTQVTIEGIALNGQTFRAEAAEPAEAVRDNEEG